MGLLGIGDNTVDIYVDKGLEFPGGNAVNVAVFSKRLGGDASYLGCVGDDDRARLLVDSLEAEGVDVSRVRRLSEPNSWSRIRHNGNDRVFDGSHRITRTEYNLAADDFDFIALHDHCHSSVYSGLEDALPEIGRAAKCFSFDFSDQFSDTYIALVAPHIDIGFLSGAQLSLDECRRLASLFDSLGCRTTVITRGPEGAVGFRNGQAIFSQPSPGRVVDTLGAGDGFIAGFLVARHSGSSFQECLNSGSRNAAKACSEQGAFGYATQSTLKQ